MATPPLGKTRRKWLIGAVVFLVVIVAGLTILSFRFESILKKQAVAMLSDRFQSQVDIRDFHASLWNLQISGGGLVLRHHGRTDVPPLIMIDRFFADADLHDLYGNRWHIRKVRVDGLKLQIPPREKRVENQPRRAREFKAAVDELICNDAQLVLMTSKPGKEPHVFDIHELLM